MQSVDLMFLRAACEWASEVKKFCMAGGVRLSPDQVRDAKLVGVAYPDMIRLVRTATIPLPDHPPLREFLAHSRLLSDATPAFAFGYGVVIRHEFANDRRVLVHELVRVSQFERRNSMEEFLAQTFWEWQNLGPRSPLSQAALLIEERLCGCRSSSTVGQLK